MTAEGVGWGWGAEEVIPINVCISLERGPTERERGVILIKMEGLGGGGGGCRRRWLHRAWVGKWVVLCQRVVDRGRDALLRDGEDE